MTDDNPDWTYSEPRSTARCSSCSSRPQDTSSALIKWPPRTRFNVRPAPAPTRPTISRTSTASCRRPGLRRSAGCCTRCGTMSVTCARSRTTSRESTLVPLQQHPVAQAQGRTLRANPLCVTCGCRGRTTAATTVDHVEPHAGDPVNFWAGPFQGLCKTCHSAGKQSEEQTGRKRGCDVDGKPFDQSIQ